MKEAFYGAASVAGYGTLLIWLLAKFDASGLEVRAFIINISASVIFFLLTAMMNKYIWRSKKK